MRLEVQNNTSLLFEMQFHSGSEYEAVLSHNGMQA